MSAGEIGTSGAGAPSRDAPSTGTQTSWEGLRRLLDERVDRRRGPAGRRAGDERGRPAVGSVDELSRAVAQDPEFSRRLIDRLVRFQSAEVPPEDRPPLPIPHQLPLGRPGFVGREGELRELDLLLAEPQKAGPDTAVISSVGGAPGVGKTALMVHWAHRSRVAFPDGQLYVNLRGYGPGSPLEPAEVLADFLHALDVAPAKVPQQLEPRAALFRTLLHERRMLVLLDNARNTAQVFPLLPGSSTCVVIVTSRNRLQGLVGSYGARSIRLDTLTARESVELLTGIVGDDRVLHERGAVEELAAGCGHLPLALSIVGERVAAYPQWPIADLLEGLGDERHRLDTFTADVEETGAEQLEVRAAFSWSYRALGAGSARCFRIMGLHPTGEFSLLAAAAATGDPKARTNLYLRGLIDCHLLEQVAPDRFRFHDLIHDYAAERAHEEESEEARQGSIRRSLLWYLHTADEANRQLMPHRRRIELDDLSDRCEPLRFADGAQALRWCDTERTHLIALVRQAVHRGEDSIAWQLPVVLWSFFNVRKLLSDWIDTHELGLRGARRSGCLRGEAWTLNSLGNAYRGTQEFEKAVETWEKALTIRRRIGDKYGEGTSLNNLAGALRRMGRIEDSIRHSTDALAIHREIRDSWNEGIDLNSLGNAYRDLGRTEEAIGCWLRALGIQREIKDLFGQGTSLNHLGEAYRTAGRADEAVAAFDEALQIRRSFGDDPGAAATAVNLGATLAAMGQLKEAAVYYTLALEDLARLGDPRTEAVNEALRVLVGKSVP
ncbi:tetratricopeptide repeat protein [Streptomyces sp. NPDC046465]|uniref:ATP-binding protein n=1 Tax=Streptomyces sp. NPDC046465 TaxID=3155810 RepID=UPI0033C57DD5